MKARLHYVGLAAAFFVCFLIAGLPAQVVYQLLGSRLLPARLYGLEGSIWSGKAAQLSLQGHTINNLQWQLSPWTLLTGDLDLVWNFDNYLGQAGGELHTDGKVIQITAVNADLDMAGLADLFVELPVTIEGRMQARDVSLHFSEQGFTNAGGILTWQKAGTISPSWLKFGSFTASLAAKDQVLKADVMDNGGAIELIGLFTLLPEYRYDYEVKIAVRDATEPGLVEGLLLLGKPDKAGRVSLSGTGYL